MTNKAKKFDCTIYFFICLTAQPHVVSSVFNLNRIDVDRNLLT